MLLLFFLALFGSFWLICLHFSAIFCFFCSCLLFFLFLVHFSAHVCSCWPIFLFFLPLPDSFLPFEYLFLLNSVLSGFFFVCFCIYLPLCLLNFAYLCSFLLLFAQFGSLQLVVFFCAFFGGVFLEISCVFPGRKSTATRLSAACGQATG